MDALERHKKVIEAAEQLLNQTFEERNVYMHPHAQNASGQYYTLCTIKFPSIMLRNSSGNSHEVTDLYVRINFIGESLGPLFEGTRGKVTQLEAGSAYSHSHLPGGAINGFANFCQGTSNFKHVQSNLQIHSWLDDNDNIPEDTLLQFEGWLFEMIGFLEWESLAGRPHKYMANIGKGSSSTINASELDLSYYRFLRFADFTKLSLKFENDKYTLQDNEAFEEELLKTACRFQYCTDDGKYYSNPNLAALGPRREFQSFVFKGETINQIVVPSSVNITAQRKLFAHRTIKSTVYDRIQRSITESQQKQSRTAEAKNTADRIARLREANASSELFLENLIPVSSD